MVHPIWVRAAVAALLCAAARGAPAQTQAQAQAVIDIKPQPLRDALRVFGEQTGLQILYRSEGLALDGKTTAGVSGTLTTRAALEQLLSASGLEYEFINERTVRISAAVTNPQSASFEEASIKIEEVIVTARHREEKLREVPMGITALTGEGLNKAQRRSFEDYAALVPGLSLAQGETPGVNRLSLRGLNAQGVGSTVAVYVDDSPIGSTSSAVNGAAFASNFDPWDMQRIEVLRGPQGMLYGASSEGGLIKFVTNPPDLTALSSIVEVGAENVDEGGTGWSGKGVLNMPLGDKVAVRISAYREQLPGFVDDTQRRKRDLNDAQKDGVRASLLWVPTSDLDIRVTLFEQDLESNGSASVDADNTTRRPLEGELTQRRALDERGTFRYQNANAAVNWNLGWASLFSGTSYNYGKNHPVSDLTLSEFFGTGVPITVVLSDPNSYVDQTGPLPTGPVGLYLINEATVRKFTQELRLHSPSEGRLDWELGAFYTRETGRVFQPFHMVNLTDGSRFGPPGYLFMLGILDSTYEERAVFGNVTYAFTPRLDVQIGGRWADNEQTSLSTRQSAFLGMPLTALPGRASADKYLYSIAPRWRVTDNWLVYGRVASGYQPGGVNLLPPGAPPEVPTQYEPDSTVNYELGTRTQWLDGRASLDVTAFRIDWTKVQLNQSFSTTQGEFGIVGNGGTAVSKGVEWTLGWLPLNGLTLSLTGAYIDATLTSDAPVVGGVSGDRLPSTPEWSSSLDGEYSWPTFASYRAYFGGTWSYAGDQVSSFSSLSDASTRVSSYVTASLRAGLENDAWTFSLYAKNIGNKRAVLSFTDSGHPAFPGSLIFNQPRTIGVAISASF